MTRKRVVVTGLGVVSCFGQDVEIFYDKLLAGVSGVDYITYFPCDDFPTRFAAQVKDFDSGEYIDKKTARRADKFIAYALVAGKKAVQHAGINPFAPEGIDKRRAGVIMGSGMGGMTTFYEGVKTLEEKGVSRLSPFFVPHIILNMGGAMLACDLGFMGPNYPVATACATGNHAIYLAARHIAAGEADLIIAGGVEAPLSPIGVAGFIACRALSDRNEAPQKASRPWDKGRDGFVLGEGAGALVLESLESAERRGVPILAEYLGGGISCDAYHITEPRPDGEGVSLCIHNALEDAKVTAKDVNYINAHATSTILGDLAELRALDRVFHDVDRGEITITATKSMIGHSLGAAGALEAIATVMAIQRGITPPTINCDDPEPTNFYIPTKAEKINIKVAISNSFGFGGHNATLIFAPYVH